MAVKGFVYECKGAPSDLITDTHLCLVTVWCNTQNRRTATVYHTSSGVESRQKPVKQQHQKLVRRLSCPAAA